MSELSDWDKAKPVIEIRYNKSGFEQYEPSTVTTKIDFKDLHPATHKSFLKLAYKDLLEKIIEAERIEAAK